jgi:hypothetical protein
VADIAVVRGEDPLTTKSKEDVVELGDQSGISPICVAGIPDLGTTPLDHTNLASIKSHSSEERVGSIQWSYIENSGDECGRKDCSESDVESDCILELFSDESFSTLSSSNSECSFSSI